MIEFEDLQMVIGMIPRLVALYQLTGDELDYQYRLRKDKSSYMGEHEKEESDHRLRTMEKIRDSFTDKEREWLLTHKEDVREILNPDSKKKKKGGKE